jgi:hypothetical protein
MHVRQKNERRTYRRSALIKCDAKISKDSQKWEEASVIDISSNGFQMIASDIYEIGELLFFEMKIYGFLSEFNVNINGVVRRKIPKEGGNASYGISFQNLAPDIKIRIDESIIKNNPQNILY